MKLTIVFVAVFAAFAYGEGEEGLTGALVTRLEAGLAAAISEQSEWRARLKAPYRYEAYLSPWQEPDEESETPEETPEMFKSTEPSLTRAERAAAGHAGYGSIRFEKDLSKAYVDVKIQGIDPTTINLFHIHCGLPGILGPILVDFALISNITENFQDDGVFSAEVTNEDIVAVINSGEGAAAAFANGCLVLSPSLSQIAGGDKKPPKVTTVAGFAHIAESRHLYFNIHTRAQSYFGDLRGQIWPVPRDEL